MLLGLESPLVTLNFMSDDHVAGYASIFKKSVFSRQKMAAYLVTWSSDIKYSVTNKLPDPINRIVSGK